MTFDIAVIDMPTLPLARLANRRRRQNIVEQVAPRLVVLDPLIHLHAVDKSMVAERRSDPRLSARQ